MVGVEGCLIIFLKPHSYINVGTIAVVEQVQRSFNEVAKSAEKCLDEASKYGEVREC